MKNIVILADQLYLIGGINSLIYLKANYWASVMNYEVTIITTEQNNQKPFYSLHESIKLVDLSINFDRKRSYFSHTNFPKVIKNYLKLNKYLKSHTPDLIIISNHIPVTFFFPYLKTKAKFLKEYHFTQFFRFKKKRTLLNRFESYIESKLDFQLVLNQEEIEFYNSARAVYIPNPIVLDLNKKVPLSNRTSTVISAGRITPVKRFDVLLEIWQKLKPTDSVWNLEIYGDGQEKDVDKLLQQISKMNLSNSVKIMGPVKNLNNVMKIKGIYAMTSAQECFPMVLLEAQSAGLPIIAFDCPTGPRNIISNNKSGILVKMDDKKSFVTKLNKLMNDKDLRISLAKNGLNSVQKFSLENVMNTWEELILSKI